MNSYTIYICSCVSNGGLYRYTLNPEGHMIPLEDCIMDRPMYAIRQDRMLYLLLQAPFGEDESGVIAIKSGDGEKMHKLGGVIPVGGKVACHLALSPSGKYLYTANYISGSVSELPMLSSQITGSPSQVVRHSGSSIHPTRQTGPHCHCTVFTPDGKFLCVSDLGLDQILLYVLGGHGLMEKPFSVCSVDPGAGPRHVVFSPNGKLAFCVNEINSTITILRYFNGHLEPLKTVPTLPKKFIGENFCAAVRISACGQFLYVSNRGHDSIACYTVEEERICLFDIVHSGGKSPRDFNLTPDSRFLICANEKSGDVITFRVDSSTGRLSPTGFKLFLDAPVCVTT